MCIRDRRHPFESCPRQAANGQQAAGGVGVGKRFENPGGGNQRRALQAGKNLLAASAAEELLGGDDRLQAKAEPKGFEHEMRPFEHRLRTPASPHTAENLDSLILRALDHGARS